MDTVMIKIDFFFMLPSILRMVAFFIADDVTLNMSACSHYKRLSPEVVIS
jgi:hypothetical protein